VETLGQPMWIGKYRLTSRIATGGMAEVYLGRHIDDEGNFGPIVAVKKLLPHLVRDSGIVRMFLNEARITAQIHHPNVVNILELGMVDGEPFIAMELLEGRTWAELRARAAEEGKRVPLGISLRILTEACRGLDAAHRAVDDSGQPLALVHRDFTPDNIHVGFKGDVKVIDFGIAKTASWGSGTEPGTLKGKFFYMSPEMILAKPVDHRADLFAAGVMLYEQLCGRRPFTGNSVDEVVLKIADGKLTPPSRYDPSVPAGLEQVTLTALNKNPDSRFPSLQEFIDALEAVGGEAQVATHAQLAEYLAAQFPESKDPRRQTLRKAREADPSQPAVRATDLAGIGAKPKTPPPRPSGPKTPVSSARRAVAMAPTEAHPAYQPFEEADTVAVAVPETSAPAARAPTDEAMAVTAPQPTPSVSQPGAAGRPKWLVPAAAAAVLVLAVGGFALLGGKKPAAALLAEAEATTDVGARSKKLAALAKAPDATDEQLARAGELLLAADQHDAALEVSGAWTVKSPKSIDAWLLEARAATEARKGKRAETAIKEASALAPNDPRPDKVLARLRELQGDAPGALEAWASAAKKKPDNATLFQEGYWLSQNNRLDDAVDVLNQVLKKQWTAEAAAELGYVRFRKEQYPEALALLKRAAQAKPDLMVAHYYLGAALYQKGDVKGARAEYYEADKLAGADSRPLAALCELEAQQEAGALDEARKKVKERFPSDAALLAKCTR